MGHILLVDSWRLVPGPMAVDAVELPVLEILGEESDGNLNNEEEMITLLHAPRAPFRLGEKLRWCAKFGHGGGSVETGRGHSRGNMGWIP